MNRQDFMNQLAAELSKLPKEEVQAAFPGCEILMQPLSLSISCHIGPGALAIACSKKIEY